MAPERLIRSESETGTRRAGERLADTLGIGDTVLLHGHLGMGKTVLTRGIAIGLGVPEEEIRSPTFTLVNLYRGRLPVYHVDLYRIDKADDLDELGLEEIIGGDGVTVIEWAERLAHYRPGRSVEITILDRGGTSRAIRIEDLRA